MRFKYAQIVKVSSIYAVVPLARFSRDEKKIKNY